MSGASAQFSVFYRPQRMDAVKETAVARGRAGEDIAARYLKKKGYRIVARNVRIGHLETDIICENRTHILFVEVKSRTASEALSRFGRPASAVNRQKVENLLACAKAYLLRHPTEKQPRLDVIEVYFESSVSSRTIPDGIVHIENAVEAE